MDALDQADIVRLDPDRSFWERFYTVAPLVVVGTRNEDEATYNLAPKHMAAPMGWEDYFGFVCTPEHKTYRNAVRHGAYTVSYPKPSQVVLASLAAAPRTERADGPRSKPSLDALPMVGATEIDGAFLEDAYLFLECTVERCVDDLGDNSLLIGKVEAVHVEESALRISERDPEDAIRDNPLLAYLAPDRYAAIDETHAFPFPEGFQK